MQTFECSSERADNAKRVAEVIQFTVCQLVDNPNEVKIDIKHGEQTTVLELSVNKADFGKVIGKQGRNALALRTILNCVGTRLKLRAVLIMLQ